MAEILDNEDTRVVGVLGGMGPDATIDFMSKVLSLTAADSDQDHVQMLVNHNPKVPDRQVDTDEQREAVQQMLAEMALQGGRDDRLARARVRGHRVAGQPDQVLDLGPGHGKGIAAQPALPGGPA